MFGDIFDSLPAWIVFCASAAVFFVSSETGFRIGRFVRKSRDHLESGSTGIVTGSILGLVSFLLAFTFSIAAANFSERRGVVLDEANAIGTAYLRADLLPEAQAEQLKSELIRYAEMRASVSKKNFSVDDYFEIIGVSEEVHAKIWPLVVQVAREAPSPITALVVASVNDVIDMHTVRVAVGVRHTIPDVIWFALYAISALALATTGYRFGASFKARSELLPGMVLAFACIVTLIADLDDPRHGFLMNDQTPMQDLLKSMQPGQT